MQQMPFVAEFDAEMTQWMTVPMLPPLPLTRETLPEWNRHVIFGYAEHHPRLGGMAWMTTSGIMELNEARGYARTESGRRYMLGSRFTYEQLPTLGREAQVAFTLLLEGCTDLPMPISVEDRDYERKWITCGKMSRHLGLMLPDYRDRDDVLKFFREHGPKYQTRLAQLLGQYPFGPR